MSVEKCFRISSVVPVWFLVSSGTLWSKALLCGYNVVAVVGWVGGGRGVVLGDGMECSVTSLEVL